MALPCHLHIIMFNLEMSCSICLEIVKDKADITERQFGILENCAHPFCLGCIRKWRVSSHMDKKVVRACPICRVTSWFVTPSDTWVEEEAEKKKLIDTYKQHLKTKHCRNFARGKGSCRFGGKCFYKHVYLDGTEEKIDAKPGGSSILSDLPLLLNDSESDEEDGNVGRFLRDLRSLMNDSDVSSESESEDDDEFDVGIGRDDDGDLIVLINGDLFII